MDSLDLQVLKDALAWHSAGHTVRLFTVVQTWGSAPRPPGALLALRGDGVVSGSVSGGCVEDDLIHRARRNAQATQADDLTPEVLTYGVTRDEAARFGLPCGGTLKLVGETLAETNWVSELLERTAKHELVARTLCMSSGKVVLTPAEPGLSVAFDGRRLKSVFGPRWRILLVGAGQLSLAVSAIARMLDFEVLVCDPRQEYKDGLDQVAVTYVEGMPDDVVTAIVPDEHTAIVALTHDPKLDDMALLEALRSKAFYVGALGSRRNQSLRKERLQTHFGMLDSELQRLHGPVGLSIGARRPAEIAVAIMAEIVACRSRLTS